MQRRSSDDEAATGGDGDASVGSHGGVGSLGRATS
jgi:hypothetical protein